MSGTFVICLVMALAAVAYWRITLLVTAAVVLALLVSGVSAVADSLHGDQPAATVVAPGGDPAPRLLPPG